MTTFSISIRKLDFQAYGLCLIRALWIALPLAILLPLHLVWHLLKLPSPWAMLFLRICARALGARVTVYGKPLRKDVFFVANHISWHDIPILADHWLIFCGAGRRSRLARNWLACKAKPHHFHKPHGKTKCSAASNRIAPSNCRKLVCDAFPRRHDVRWARAFAVQAILVCDFGAATQADDDPTCTARFR